MQQVKISVILTSYNKSKYIGRAIESVLNQSFKDIELIVADDGSSDNSREVIMHYADKDKRIRPFFFEENQGIPSAHNFAIRHASGEYCAMIDCDDFWEKDKLEKQLAVLDKRAEYGACFTWIKVVDENEEEVTSEECENRDLMWNSQNHTQGEWLRIFFMEGCKLGNPSMLVRKKVLDEVGYYSYGLKQLQDYDLFIRILKKCNVYIIPEKLVNYRWFRGEVKNTSFDSMENASRSNFEYYLICKNYFLNMDVEVFKEGFADYISGECNCEIEVISQQIFITLTKYLVPVTGRAVALENLYLLLNNENYREAIRKKYGITSTTFAQELKETIFMDVNYFMPKDRDIYSKEVTDEINQIKKEWYRENEYNKELTDSLEEIQNYKISIEATNREQSGVIGEQKKYISELEKECREQSSVIGKQKDYISELEKTSREQSDIIGKQQNYIKELEQEVKKNSDLYRKCNEYVMELEKKIRDKSI